MKTYRVYGIVTGSKFIGEYEAESATEAEEMAWNDADVSICHQCSREIDGPEIFELDVEEKTTDKPDT